MKFEGGCYCGALRYQAEGDALFKGLCHCRECQYISGGSANAVMGVAESSFSYTKGSPLQFAREELERPATREFCARCGTHILAKSPALPGAVMLKVGTLDDPKLFGDPQMAIYCAEMQSFHRVPEGVATFEGLPS
jgi:hypothetical protein